MVDMTTQQLTITQWSSKDPSKRFTVENPATGEILANVAGGDAETAQAAVAASQEAFNTWRWKHPAARGALLLKCADAVEARKEELAELLCRENGKPRQDALMGDVTFLVNILRFFGSLVDKLPTEFYDRGEVYTSVFQEPYGVCVGILPFNWPPIHAGGKLAPCLAAGNTMILKPGEQAPLTVLRLVEILQDVLPPNVLMVVPGAGVEVPQALVGSPTVRAVSFTGSTAGGAAVARTAAATIKPLKLELGGKNALMVFEDANLDRAIGDAIQGSFFNKGEACTATSRLLVHESVYDEFVQRLGAAVSKLVTGDGMDSKTHIGPCITKAAKERVLEFIEKGKAEGATIAAQGPPPTDPRCRDGFFVHPTLFSNVTRDMTIAKEEMFGPISCVIKFRTEDEAVSIVNESPYGLTALVFSQDMERCLRVGRKVDVGMFWINNFNRNFLGMPFGGAKASGYGREHCIETLREWSRAKTMYQPSGLGPWMRWRTVDDVLDRKGGMD